MANDGARKSSTKGDGRESGGFIALPWAVMDSPAFLALSHPAKALLLEFARQHYFHKGEGMHTNGRLLANSKTLLSRGWRSGDTITRAKRELISVGFLYETVKGHRPNKASWYALTWFALPMRPSYDQGVMSGFVRSAFLKNAPLKIKGLIPPHGVETSQIAPPHGVERSPTIPPNGAVIPAFTHSSIPSNGNQSRGLPSTYKRNNQVIQLTELRQG